MRFKTCVTSSHEQLTICHKYRVYRLDDVNRRLLELRNMPHDTDEHFIEKIELRALKRKFEASC